MKGKLFFNEDIIKSAIDLYNMGCSINEIASRIKKNDGSCFNPKTIKNLLLDNGVILRSSISDRTRKLLSIRSKNRYNKVEPKPELKDKTIHKDFDMNTFSWRIPDDLPESAKNYRLIFNNYPLDKRKKLIEEAN